MLGLRRYQPGDDARIRELHEEAMRAVGAFVAGGPDADLQRIPEEYLDSGGDFLVGEVNGRIVAMGAFRPLTGYLVEYISGVTDASAELKRMRVDPAYHRLGYGQQIYDALEQSARDRGYDESVLDTTPNQVGARQFFETNGFRKDGHVELDPEFLDDGLELVLYRKSLPE